MTGNPADGNFDSDGDGWSDLMEFVLGTDPGVWATNDPLALRLPVFRMSAGILLTRLEKRLALDFVPAPWLLAPSDLEWEIVVEASDDLGNWEEVEIPSGLSERMTVWQAVANDQRAGWMRVRVRRGEGR